MINIDITNKDISMIVDALTGSKLIYAPKTHVSTKTIQHNGECDNTLPNKLCIFHVKIEYEVPNDASERTKLYNIIDDFKTRIELFARIFNIHHKVQSHILEDDKKVYDYYFYKTNDE